MSKFACNCGHVMKLSCGDNIYEYSLVAEKEINEIIGILEQGGNIIDLNFFLGKINSGRVDVLRCPKCKRLWLKNDDDTYSSYIKETVDTV